MSRRTSPRAVKRKAGDDAVCVAGRAGYTPRVDVTREFFLEEVKPFVKRHRPRAVEREGRGDILHLQAYVRYHNKKNSQGRKVTDVNAKVAEMLGRGKAVVGQVWRDFLGLRKMFVSNRPVNRVTGSRRVRVPRTDKVRAQVQAFMREQREERRHVSAITLCDFMRAKGIISYDQNSATARRSAHRAVQRYVKALGFKRGNKKGELGYKLSEKNEAHLTRFLRFMKANREAPEGQRRRIITQDESYCHENYRRKDSLYDPGDTEEQHTKEAPPGRRFCFIGTAIGPDLNVPEEERVGLQRGQFLMESFDVFLGGTRKRSAKKRTAARLVSSGTRLAEMRAFAEELGLNTKDASGKQLQKKPLWALLLEHEKNHPDALRPSGRGNNVGGEDEGKHEEDEQADQLPQLAYNGKFSHEKKETKDYHGMFNHPYMVAWFRAFLEMLAAAGLFNTIIVMDNAKYHKCYPASIPKYGAPKAKIIEALRTYGVPFEDGMAKPELVLLLKKYVEENVDYVLVAMAKEAGHELIFSPPHYSDLQPIEIIWAQAKGAVARQYSLDTKIGDTYQRLWQAFENLTAKQVEGCFRSCIKQEMVLIEHYEKLDRMEAEDAQRDTPDSSSSDDDRDGFASASDSDGGTSSDPSDSESDA